LRDFTNFLSSFPAKLVLLFTNVEGFHEKIRAAHRPIRDWYPSYEGYDRDADAAFDFFADMFVHECRDSGKVVVVEYIHRQYMKILQKAHQCVNIALES
jgi:hypothetical protein